MNLAQQYAKGIDEASRGKRSAHELFAAVLLALKRRGHEKLMPRIYAELRKLQARRPAAEVRYAREADKAVALAKAKELLAEVAPTELELCEDPGLISGYAIRGSDFRYDASARRSLIELYKRLVA